MSFAWLNKQGVQSSNGFILQSMHRFFYHYIEGPKRIQVDVEPLQDEKGNYYEGIYSDSIRKWLPPHDHESVSHEQSDRIRRNISAALVFMGTAHKFM